MRIARLTAENPRTQGAERRAWYRAHSPDHLRLADELCKLGLRARTSTGPARAVVLGAGACTEIPLDRLAHATASVLLVDIDVAGMAKARDALPAAIRGRVDLLQADLTGGVSDALAGLLAAQPWADLGSLGRFAPLDAAADCLERCPVPDPPTIPGLTPGGYDFVISDLVLTQLFSLPLLDVGDTLTYQAAGMADLRDEHPRYHTAALAFRRRIALAHLGLLRALLAPGGAAVLMSDRVGHLLPAKHGAHTHDARESLAVLPSAVLAIPDDLDARFTRVGDTRTWEWLVTAPTAETPGRLYDAFGVILRPRE